MTDDRLKTTVLARADADEALSEHARLVVLAALESPEELADALGGAGVSGQPADSPTTPETTAEPVGAYLASITVQGFRGRA